MWIQPYCERNGLEKHDGGQNIFPAEQVAPSFLSQGLIGKELTEELLSLKSGMNNIDDAISKLSIL